MLLDSFYRSFLILRHISFHNYYERKYAFTVQVLTLYTIYLMFSTSLHRYVKRVLLVTKLGLRLRKMGRIYINNYLVLHEMLNSVQSFFSPHHS